MLSAIFLTAVRAEGPAAELDLKVVEEGKRGRGWVSGIIATGPQGEV